MAARSAGKEGRGPAVREGNDEAANEGKGPAGKQTKKKKEPPDPLADTSPLGLLKREAAERLGLLEKVKSVGWAGLSAAETGRIGALVSRLLKERAPEGEGAPAGGGARSPEGGARPREGRARSRDGGARPRR